MSCTAETAYSLINAINTRVQQMPLNDQHWNNSRPSPPPRKRSCWPLQCAATATTNAETEQKADRQLDRSHRQPETTQCAIRRHSAGQVASVENRFGQLPQRLAGL